MAHKPSAQTQSPEAWAQQLNFAAIEARYGLPKGILMEVCRQESGGDPNAKGPVTRNGECAQGLFQFMPGTAEDFGINPYDPAQAAEAAGKYLARNLSKPGSNLNKALAGYNWGPGNVSKAVEKYGDDWLAHAPRETQQYVANITGRMRGEMFWRDANEMPRATKSFEEVEADAKARQEAEGKDQDWLKQIGGMFNDAGSMIVGFFMMLLVAATGKNAHQDETGKVHIDTTPEPSSTESRTPPATVKTVDVPAPSDPAKAKAEAAKAVNGCEISKGVCVAEATAQTNLPKAPWDVNLGLGS